MHAEPMRRDAFRCATCALPASCIRSVGTTRLGGGRRRRLHTWRPHAGPGSAEGHCGAPLPPSRAYIQVAFSRATGHAFSAAEKLRYTPHACHACHTCHAAAIASSVNSTHAPPGSWLHVMPALSAQVAQGTQRHRASREDFQALASALALMHRPPELALHINASSLHKLLHASPHTTLHQPASPTVSAHCTPRCGKAAASCMRGLARLRRVLHNCSTVRHLTLQFAMAPGSELHVCAADQTLQNRSIRQVLQAVAAMPALVNLALVEAVGWCARLLLTQRSPRWSLHAPSQDVTSALRHMTQLTLLRLRPRYAESYVSDAIAALMRAVQPSLLQHLEASLHRHGIGTDDATTWRFSLPVDRLNALAHLRLDMHSGAEGACLCGLPPMRMHTLVHLRHLWLDFACDGEPLDILPQLWQACTLCAMPSYSLYSSLQLHAAHAAMVVGLATKMEGCSQGS